MSYLVFAYLIVFIVVGGYILSLVRRQQHLMRDLQLLRRAQGSQQVDVKKERGGVEVPNVQMDSD